MQIRQEDEASDVEEGKGTWGKWLSHCGACVGGEGTRVLTVGFWVTTHAWAALDWVFRIRTADVETQEVMVGRAARGPSWRQLPLMPQHVQRTGRGTVRQRRG